MRIVLYKFCTYSRRYVNIGRAVRIGYAIGAIAKIIETCCGDGFLWWLLLVGVVGLL